MALPKNDQPITFADYMKWDEDILCEAFNGQIFYMSPSPTPEHQQIVANLTTTFGIYLRGKSCFLFPAPMDVWLFDSEGTSPEKVKDWVQPDLLIICDKSNIGQKRIYGAPNLVTEVFSQSTAKRDKIIKLTQYQKAGVQEYWIADPLNQLIDVYLLDDGQLKYDGVYSRTDHIPVKIFKDLSINLNLIFPLKEEEE